MDQQLTREILSRLDALERRLGQAEPLPAGEGRAHDAGETASGRAEESTEKAEAFWALSELRRRLPAGSGGVVYTGAVPLGEGTVEWQYGAATEQLDDLSEEELENTAATLAALGSAVRLRLLQAVLNGADSVAALAELEGMGTTGQIYHHVRTLTAAGWLRSAGRKHLQVPPTRVVPLYVALTLAGQS